MYVYILSVHAIAIVKAIVLDYEFRLSRFVAI